MLDIAYRERYSVRDAACRSHSADRAHARAMLADGHVERAVRWARDPRSGLQGMLFAADARAYRDVLLPLALEAGWIWLLEPWQADAELPNNYIQWSVLVAAAAIETGSLPLVQEHWPRLDTDYRSLPAVWRALGRCISMEVFDWLLKRGGIGVVRTGTFAGDLMESACEYGHVALMETTARMVAAGQQWFGPTGMWSTAFLQLACSGGHLHAVEWLVSRQAVPDKCCIEAAVEQGHYTVLRYLHEQTGVPGTHVDAGIVRPMLSRSKPDCLAVLEHVVQHLQYEPVSVDIVHAATAANVRSDVLRFLSRHGTQEAWSGALSRQQACGDLDVQDLLHAAARDTERREGCH